MHWVAAWAAAPQGPFPYGYAFDTPVLRSIFQGDVARDQTLRLIVHCAAGGSHVRIRLSNLFGDRPLAVGAAYVGLPSAAARLVPGTNRRLTFGGRPVAVVPPGRDLASDPVALGIVAGQELAISLYIPAVSPAMTWHASAFTTSYSTAQGAGDHAADVGAGAYLFRTTSWFWLDGVDVYSSAAGAVVALGDSITDGWKSIVDRDGRWPDVLARRLLAVPPARRLSVIDMGIAGNSLVPERIPCRKCGPPAVARLGRDVLAQPGLRAVIVFEGINDIGHGTSAARVIAGLRAIAGAVHRRGLPVYAATLLPDGGSSYTKPRFCHCAPAAREHIRQQVNAFIRTSKVFDGVIDLDLLLRDPLDRTRLAPAYDSGDHLHPNALGLQFIGEIIPLRYLERAAAQPHPQRSRPVSGGPARPRVGAPAAPAARRRGRPAATRR